MYILEELSVINSSFSGSFFLNMIKSDLIITTYLDVKTFQERKTNKKNLINQEKSFFPFVVEKSNWSVCSYCSILIYREFVDVV